MASGWKSGGTLRVLTFQRLSWQTDSKIRKLTTSTFQIHLVLVSGECVAYNQVPVKCDQRSRIIAKNHLALCCSCCTGLFHIKYGNINPGNSSSSRSRLLIYGCASLVFRRFLRLICLSLMWETNPSTPCLILTIAAPCLIFTETAVFVWSYVSNLDPLRCTQMALFRHKHHNQYLIYTPPEYNRRVICKINVDDIVNNCKNCFFMQCLNITLRT